MTVNKENITIFEKLKNLPSTPGVYQFKDASGKVIYIGKANVLRSRVRQYFNVKPVSAMLDAMISKIADIEVISTDSEVEALILEQNLVKAMKPRYNINLKDDKSYPYIVITNEPFPRVFPTRKKRSDGSKYFGPYTDVKTMRFALKTVRDIFMIRSCSLNLTEASIEKGKFKICLDYHIHKCEGPCEGFVSREEYNKMISQVAKLLNGKTATLIKELEDQMEYYASNMEFEKAAQLRDKIEAVEVYSSKQKMVGEEIIDRDIFAFEREDNEGVGMVLKIRDGKVIGKQNFLLSNVLGKSEGEILENMLMNYYTKTDFVPEEIFIPELESTGDGEEFESEKVIEDYLIKKKDGKVSLITPKIGEKAKLVSMVRRNAKLVLDEIKLTKMKNQFIPPSVESLKRDLRLKKLPRTIECFDISHIQGTDTVASMVVFHDGKPKKSAYRKFRLRNNLNEIGKPDDFLSMREVIYRRYKKVAEEDLTEKKSEEVQLPDLIIIDGGKGQLSSAVRVLEDIGIKPGEDVNVIGLAKKLEEVFIPGDPVPQNIPKTSSGLKLLQRVRDEAHRFAVTYHRTLREKRTFKTELEEIPGIGNKTAKKLLTEFGSVENIKEVLKNNYNAIETSAGKSAAEKIKEYYSEIISQSDTENTGK